MRSLWEWRRPAAFAKRGHVGTDTYGLAGWRGAEPLGVAASPPPSRSEATSAMWATNAMDSRGGGETPPLPGFARFMTVGKHAGGMSLQARGGGGTPPLPGMGCVGGDDTYGLTGWRRDAASPRVCRIRAGFKPDSSRGADAPGCIPKLGCESGTDCTCYPSPTRIVDLWF